MILRNSTKESSVDPALMIQLVVILLFAHYVRCCMNVVPYRGEFYVLASSRIITLSQSNLVIEPLKKPAHNFTFLIRVSSHSSRWRETNFIQSLGGLNSYLYRYFALEYITMFLTRETCTITGGAATWTTVFHTFTYIPHVYVKASVYFDSFETQQPFPECITILFFENWRFEAIQQKR